ncbi:MAG: hypothetical protein U0892_11975 [Pirellulales bacterium]
MRSRKPNRFLFAAVLCSTALSGQALRAQSIMASWPSPFAEPSAAASVDPAPEPVHEFRSLLGSGSSVSGKSPANSLSVGVLQPPPNRVFSTVAYPQVVGAASGAPSAAA